MKPVALACAGKGVRKRQAHVGMQAAPNQLRLVAPRLPSRHLCLPACLPHAHMLRTVHTCLGSGPHPLTSASKERS